ncbi:MAG TPA: CapA family protein, partial [Anaerolineae bacterium]|nr:CapA family protein [Anaerolineae bacterium]
MNKTIKEAATLKRTVVQHRLLMVLGLLALLAACQYGGENKIHQAATDALAMATQTDPPVIKATPIPTPQPVKLSVPSRWLQAVERSISELPQNPARWLWDVIEAEDPPAELSQGRAHVALVPGNQGEPAGSRPLAFVVPFATTHDALTLSEAEQILDQGSGSVEVVDWAEVTAEKSVLRVDGFHPSDADYPMMQSWSLIAAPGFESAAAELGPGLQTAISQDQVVMLAAVGDIILDVGLGETIAFSSAGDPFAEVSELLTTADLTIGNFEAALGDQGQPADKEFTFRAPAEAVLSLESAGFDLLSLANNHAMDYGPHALLQGIDLLLERGIATVGAGRDEVTAHLPFIFRINDMEVAFLSYVNVPVEWHGFDTRSWSASPTQPGVAWADPERIRSEVEAATYAADLVIVLLHSGNECIYQPSSVQEAAAHAAIEAGATLVLGHHAHVLQGVEFYGGGVIAYGLGDFTFPECGTHSGAIFNLWLDARGVRQLEVVPIVFAPDGHPLPAEGEQAATIRNLVVELTN